MPRSGIALTLMAAGRAVRHRLEAGGQDCLLVFDRTITDVRAVAELGPVVPHPPSSSRPAR